MISPRELFLFLFIQLLWPGIIESSLLDCRFQRHSKYTNRSRSTRLPYRLPFIRDFPQRFPRRPCFKRPSNPPSFTLIPSFLLAPHTTATVLHRASISLAAAGIHPPHGPPLTPLGHAQFPPAPFGGPQFPPFRNRRQPSISIGGPPKT